MDTTSNKGTSFTDLMSYERIQTSATTVAKNVIKSTAITDTGLAKIEIIDGEEGTPTIQVQREGDTIKQIEFICTCGKSAHLDLEYDEE